MAQKYASRVDQNNVENTKTSSNQTCARYEEILQKKSGDLIAVYENGKYTLLIYIGN